MTVQHQLYLNSNLLPEDRQTRHQLLKFYLQSNLAAVIEIGIVTELIDIPMMRVVPMPHLPSAAIGVYNWRGEILWIADLGVLLKLNSQAPQRMLQPTIVVTTPSSTGEPKTLGLVVDAIADIEWYEQGNVDPQHPSPFLPWLKGYWRSATGEILPELDTQALLDRADLHADL